MPNILILRNIFQPGISITSNIYFITQNIIHVYTVQVFHNNHIFPTSIEVSKQKHVCVYSLHTWLHFIYYFKTAFLKKGKNTVQCKRKAESAHRKHTL